MLVTAQAHLRKLTTRLLVAAIDDVAAVVIAVVVAVGVVGVVNLTFTTIASFF